MARPSIFVELQALDAALGVTVGLALLRALYDARSALAPAIARRVEALDYLLAS